MNPAFCLFMSMILRGGANACDTLPVYALRCVYDGQYRHRARAGHNLIKEESESPGRSPGADRTHGASLR